jgi:hypothetical protein
MIQIILENNGGRKLVNNRLPLFAIHISLSKQPLSFFRGKGFVPFYDRHGDTFFKDIDKPVYLFALDSLGTIKSYRIPDNYPFSTVFFEKLLYQFNIALPVLSGNRSDSPGCYAKLVADRYPYSLFSVI